MSINFSSMQGAATFKGFVKNGLDSSTIINLISAFDGKFDEFRKNGFTFPPNLFFYHEISRTEVIGVLINRHKFTKQEAIEAFDNMVTEFDLGKIVHIPQKDGLYMQIVQNANKAVVKKLGKPDLTIGEADTLIIAGFLRENITFVHSGDQGFLKTCEELKMNIVPLAQGDRSKEKEIKQWMKRRKD